MPFLRITTNQDLVTDEREQFATEASREVAAALGKPEDYMMVAVEKADAMLFGGRDDPTALLELRGLGLPEDKTPALSELLCDLCQKHIQVAPHRVYINFLNMPRHMWGWDGKTFG